MNLQQELEGDEVEGEPYSDAYETESFQSSETSIVSIAKRNMAMLPTRSDQTRTPLPWAVLIWTTMVYFCAMMGRQVARPFLPFFVQQFFEGLPSEDIGYFLGIVLAALDLGALVGSFLYGIIADRFGRKPTLLAGVFGTMVLIPVFGFSVNYTMAVITITIWGALAANLPIGRTIVTEVTDATNQATAFAIFMTVPGAVRTTAPLIGGYLSQPAENYTIFANLTVFINFPYALPLLVTGAVACITFAGVYCTVPETLEHVEVCRVSKPYEIGEQDYQLRVEGEDKSGILENERLIEFVDTSNPNKSAWKDILSDRLIMTTIFVYVINGFCLNVIHTVFPIWVILPTDIGGFSMGPQEIGVVLALIGPFEFLYQATFPALSDVFGFRLLLLGGTFVMTILTILMPMVAFINDQNYTLVVFCIVIVYLGIVCMRLTIQTSIFVVLGMLANNRNRGRVNSLSYALLAAVRFVGPILSGSLFAWSVNTNGSYPLNHFFVFHILSILNFLGFLVALTLPTVLSKPVHGMKSVW